MADEMQQDEMQELIREFVIETDEVLEGLDQCFVKLEESPGDLSLINEIFRAVHSIKGSAGFLGFTRLVEVAHQSENVLNKLRQKDMQATSETIDIILESIDVLKILITEIKDKAGARVEINTIKTKLSLLLEYSASLDEAVCGVSDTAVVNKVEPDNPVSSNELQENRHEPGLTTEDENPSPYPLPLGERNK